MFIFKVLKKENGEEVGFPPNQPVKCKMCREIPSQNNAIDGYARASVIVLKRVLKNTSENRQLNTPS